MFEEIKKVLKGYDLNNLTIGVLGGHSALDVCRGAKKYGFNTVAVCQKEREETYSKYYKTRKGLLGKEIGCIDNVIVVENFGDIVNPEVQEELRKLNTIFIHNRYFWVYCNFAKIESEFKVPIFGNRDYVRKEERDVENNQYVLLKKANIRLPEIIREGGKSYEESELKQILDSHFKEGGPLIVKANEKIRKYERAFFVITSTDDYFRIGADLITNGTVDPVDLSRAVIEEFIIGAQVNFNFYYCPLQKQLELIGTDMRRQTSMDGFLRLDAVTQTDLINKGYKPTMVETGHVAVTIKESLVQKAYDIGEKFINVTKKELGREIVGPFALQGAVASYKGKEELVIFDVSMRIPGSPGTASTPYSGYLFGESISFGERIAMGLKATDGDFEKILTMIS